VDSLEREQHGSEIDAVLFQLLVVKSALELVCVAILWLFWFWHIRIALHAVPYVNGFYTVSGRLISFY
jgi:hypothetical protein